MGPRKAESKMKSIQSESSKNGDSRKQQNGSSAIDEHHHHDAPPPTPLTSVVAAIALLVFTYFTLPDPLQPVGKPSIHHVWYYGWITAISTGLGVLPLVFIPELDSYWVGISNGKLRFATMKMTEFVAYSYIYLPPLNFCMMQQALHLE
jgi:hypothetical protein